MDTDKQALADQGTAYLRDFVPPYLWSMFSAYKEAGFSQTEAFTLTQMHLFALIGNVQKTQ